jgi:hypothetical protein
MDLMDVGTNGGVKAHPYRTALDVAGGALSALPAVGGTLGKVALGSGVGSGLASGGAAAANASPLVQAIAALTGGIVGGNAVAGAGNTARALANASGPLETASALGKGALGLNPAAGAAVPKGQEAQALLNLARQNFALPESVTLPEGAINQGALKGILAQGRSALGASKGAAQDAAYAAAQQNLSSAPGGAGALPALLQKAIGSTVQKFGGGEVPALAESPEAAATLGKLSKDVVPQVDTLEKANALQRQLASQAAAARNPLAPTAPQANMLGNAATNVDSVIKSFIPEGDELNNLNAANQKFSSFANLQKMAMKASDSQGNFNPKTFFKAWNVLTPQDKAKMFSPEQSSAIDALLKQPQPGALTKLANFVATPVKKLISETVARNSQLGAMLERPAAPQVQFNQPGLQAVSGWSRTLPWLQGAVQGAPLAQQ